MGLDDGGLYGSAPPPLDAAWTAPGGPLGAAAVAVRAACRGHLPNRDRAAKTGAVVALVGACACARVDLETQSHCAAALRVVVGDDAPDLVRVLHEAGGRKALVALGARLGPARAAHVDGLLAAIDRSFGPDPAARAPRAAPKPPDPEPSGAHWADPKLAGADRERHGAWQAYQANYGRASRFPQYHADEPPPPPPPPQPAPPLAFRPPTRTALW